MDLEIRQKILKKLSETKGEKAEMALIKEANKIATSLKSENNYENINLQLKLLDTIAFRVSAKAMTIIKALMDALKTLELIHASVLGVSDKKIQEFHNKSFLIRKILEVIAHLRYLETDSAIVIFLEYAIDDDERVRKTAIDGLNHIAEFNIQAFQRQQAKPQQLLIEKFCVFDDVQKQAYFDVIFDAATRVLSPSMEDTEWGYQTMTLKTGSVPATEDVKEVREKAIQLLIEMYELSDKIEQKKKIITGFHSATRLYDRSKKIDPDFVEIRKKNTLQIIKFLNKVVSSADVEMQIIQQIESKAYWIHYHCGDDSIRAKALEVKKVVDGIKEYSIFKILIGFEGILKEWGTRETNKEILNTKISDEIRAEENIRDKKSREYAEIINERNYNEWKDRIERYASIESNDMATFPYFAKFLEHLGKTSPVLSLQLIQSESTIKESFFVPLLNGVWQTSQKKNARKILVDWANGSMNLFACARLFEFSSEPDEDILKTVLNKAKESNDFSAIIKVMAAAAANYNPENKHLIRSLFLPAIEFFTLQQNSNWIFDFWFRKQHNEIIQDMNKKDYQVILDNLVYLPQIDYHVEEILVSIAQTQPEEVINFFGKRIHLKKDGGFDSAYDAIPYEFHKLSEPLSTIPDKAVDIVSGWYDGNYSAFMYRGGRLLQNIFKNFAPLENKLTQLVQMKDDKNIIIVLAILRNYEDTIQLHSICKELIKVIPEGDMRLTDVEIVLQTTGVVNGEFGMMKAYEHKLNEINYWLEDPDHRIQQFALSYTKHLEERICSEEKRAKEIIDLDKYKYGEQ